MMPIFLNISLSATGRMECDANISSQAANINISGETFSSSFFFETYNIWSLSLLIFHIHAHNIKRQMCLENMKVNHIIILLLGLKSKDTFPHPRDVIFGRFLM